jgi:hypothetical protein
VTTNAVGDATFQATVAAAPAGWVITATATHLATGNTSEFSACRATSGAPALQMTGALSRKWHGAAGAANLPLMLDGNSAVEGRSGGANGEHTVEFSFNRAITNGSVIVTTGQATISGPPAIADNKLTINLSGATDAQVVTLLLRNVTDSSGTAMPDTLVRVAFLFGDTNGDGVVNTADALQTRNRSGQLTDSANYRCDVNVDGIINGADTLIVRGRSGNGVNIAPDSAATE